MIIIMYFAFLLRLLYYFLGFVPEDDLIFLVCCLMPFYRKEEKGILFKFLRTTSLFKRQSSLFDMKIPLHDTIFKMIMMRDIMKMIMLKLPLLFFM